MSKLLKVIFLSFYCTIFLHILKYLLFGDKEDVLELNYLVRVPGTLKRMMKEIKKNKNNTTIITPDFKQPLRLPTDLKYILTWNDAVLSSKTLAYGQNMFLNYNCTFYNCFLTSDKSIILDMRYFDVITFDVSTEWDEHPPLRAPFQYYIFVAIESAKHYPMCNPNFDNYFNMTWTYKLDSDIRRSAIKILDKRGNVVGPKINMTWIDPMKPTPEDVKKKLKGKKKGAAWFIWDCDSIEGTNLYYILNNINKTLAKENLHVDMYGWCGNKKCPKDRIEECLILLKKDYYFYISFESSLTVDYITEDLLYPLINFAVPVVYGGANYSRFLPPGSYIDASILKVEEVCSLMVKAIKNASIYYDYFKWHNHYVFKESPKEEGICTLCEILNDPKRSYNVIRDFRNWWNPNC